MPFVSAEPYTIYLDESGDHSLDIVDPQYPIFGLAGVLMENGDHATAAAALSAWKTGFFGKDVCLHMREIARNVGPFHVLKDAEVRSQFIHELQGQLDAQNFMLICSVLDKNKHLAEYGKVAQNPYNVTLEFLIERFYFEMRDNRNGARAGFIAESRSDFLDAALQAHYADLMANGTRYVAAKHLSRAFPKEIIFERKHTGAIGLQIADLAIGPISREAAGMKPQASAISLQHKLRTDAKGNAKGYGLVVFPKEK